LTGDSGSVQKLTYAEFKVAAAMSRMSVKDDVLRPIFDDMDSDKGGKISLQEFCVWYSRMKDNMDAGQTPQPQPRAALSASKPRITSRRPLSTSGSSAFSSAARRPPSSAAAQVSDTNPAFQRVTAEKKKSPFEVNLVKAFDAAQARKTAGSLREVKVPAGGALSAIKSINTARMMESPRDEPTPSIVTLSKQQLLAALPAEAVAAMQRSSISPEHDSLREPAKFGAALVDWLEKRWAEVQAHKETLQAAWKTLDENGNGLISGAEVDTWIVKRFPKMHVKPAVRQAFLMCRGEDGFIHRPKFGQLLNSIILCCRAWIMFDELNLADAVKQAAYKADPDARAYKDSRIQLEEFRVCFQKLFPAAMTGQCEAEWALMDADGKGMVLFGEFCVWYAAKAASGFRLADPLPASSETHISGDHVESDSSPAEFGAALVDWLEKRWAEVQAHKETLQAAWKTLDENGNGLISGAEVDTWIVKRFPKMHVKPAVRQAFLMCRGEDGFIHRPKFGQLLNSIILCCRAWIMFDELNLADAVKQAAYKADPDARAYKDSRIQLEEFRVCFQKLFPAAMTGQCEAEWALMDADGKGMVLFGEFCVWYAAKAASGFRLSEITAKNETPKKQGTHQHEKQDVSYEDDEDFLEAIEVSELPKELSPRSNVLVGVRTVLQGVVANAASRSPSSSPVHGSRPSSAVVSGTSGVAATSGKAKDVDCELSPRSSVLVGVRTVLQGVVANAASRSPSSSPISSRPSSAVVIGEDKSRNRS
jgi:Ca2+-binding EF-hand superfamily protein